VQYPRTQDDPAPIVRTADRSVEVDQSTVHIHDLSIDRPSIVEYLRGIAPGKQEIALLHALEVGIKELAVRREHFKH
jgi:hypothetical protein